MTQGEFPASRAETHPAAASVEVELAYRRLPLLADYFRGWAGLGLAALPLVTMAPSWPVSLGLLALIGLFVGFLVQTWRRQHSRVLLVADRRCADRRRRSGGWPGAIWTGCGCAGSARAVRAAAGSSWSCAAAAVRLVVTSALDRFDGVVAEAVQAANDRGLPLEPATRANVEALLGRAA